MIKPCGHFFIIFIQIHFQRRLEGTKVTVESFLAWKAQFDAERLSKKEIVVTSEQRLTGKELFLKNISLNDSDIKFLSEGKAYWQFQKNNLYCSLGVTSPSLS